jgi:LPXTG-motif cell wall-anchored protein
VSATPVPVTSAAPAVTPGKPAVTSTPAVPQATAATTIVDIPVEGEIPLGGIPSLGDGPDHGTVTFTPDGKWIYTPDSGYIGKDEFTIVVTDEDGNEEEVVIEVGVDDVPKGTVTDTADNADETLPGKLPKTGESSPIPLYLTGGGLILLGIILARRFKTRK